MMNHYNFPLLRRLVGTTVTTYDDISNGAPRDRTSSERSSSFSRVLPYRTRSTSERSISTVSSISTQPPTTTEHAVATQHLPTTTTTEGTRAWIIKEKLSEEVYPLTEQDVKMGYRTSKTVGKFLCSPVDDPSEVAFMRTYQILENRRNRSQYTTSTDYSTPAMCRERLKTVALFLGS